MSSESLVPVFAMSLGKAGGHSQLPDDNFIPDMKCPQLSASNLKKAKRRFATISSKEIKAAKKPIGVKNTQNLLCELFVYSRHGQRSKTSIATRYAPSKCFALAI